MDYQIVRSSRRTMAIEIKETSLVVRAPFYATDKAINSFVLRHKDWIDTHMIAMEERKKKAEEYPSLSLAEIRVLSDQAKKLIPERAAYYASQIGVTYQNITIRKQKTRWGSCSSKGNLNFNCLLMLAPLEVIDSVVVHELCHRKEMNHSSRFYKEVLKVYPQYWECNQWLKDNAFILSAARESKQEIKK